MHALLPQQGCMEDERTERPCVHKNVAFINYFCHDRLMSNVVAFADPSHPARRKRGRPRQFDLDAAVAVARELFEADGYDRVSLPDLTGAMGINPPSFYSAFGSKAALFIRILESYSGTWLDNLRAAFMPDREVEAALSDILQLAAHRFAPTDEDGVVRRGGCLILEAGINCSDAMVTEAIRKARLALATTIYRGIAWRQPEHAAVLTDFMMAQLAGLSAAGRDGTDIVRLLGVARMAATAIRHVSA